MPLAEDGPGTWSADDLRAWRGRMGWTQRQAAEALGYHVAAWKNLEYGKRRISFKLQEAAEIEEALRHKKKPEHAQKDRPGRALQKNLAVNVERKTSAMAYLAAVVMCESAKYPGDFEKYERRMHDAKKECEAVFARRAWVDENGNYGYQLRDEANLRAKKIGMRDPEVAAAAQAEERGQEYVRLAKECAAFSLMCKYSDLFNKYNKSSIFFHCATAIGRLKELREGRTLYIPQRYLDWGEPYREAALRFRKELGDTKKAKPAPTAATPAAAPALQATPNGRLTKLAASLAHIALHQGLVRQTRDRGVLVKYKMLADQCRALAATAKPNSVLDKEARALADTVESSVSLAVECEVTRAAKGYAASAVVLWHASREGSEEDASVARYRLGETRDWLLLAESLPREKKGDWYGPVEKIVIASRRLIKDSPKPSPASEPPAAAPTARAKAAPAAATPASPGPRATRPRRRK